MAERPGSSRSQGGKIKENGNYVIDKNGPHTVSLDVRDGKVAGMHVKHETKGKLPVNPAA